MFQIPSSLFIKRQSAYWLLAFSTILVLALTSITYATPNASVVTVVNNHSPSADANYHGLSIDNVTATIADDDTVGIVLSKTAVAVAESGANDSYTIVLSSQPTADVTIAITDDAQCATNIENLIFTATNWDTLQTVIVTAVDDAVLEGDHSCTITHAASSVDMMYDNFAMANVTGTITDDEAPIVTTNLLNNGGFEVAGASKALPAGWTVQNAKGDKRLCPAKPNNLHGGACAFKFTDNGNGATKLTQTVDLLGHTFRPEDTFTLTAYFKGVNSTAKLKIRLFIYYSGATVLVKGNFTAPRNVSYVQYTLPSYHLDAGGLDSADIKQIKLEFAHPSNAGTLWIDDVSVIHTIPAVISRETPLSLPVVP